MGRFHDSVKNNVAPKAAADQEIDETSDVLATQLAVRDALFSDNMQPFLNAAPKFSTGPRSVVTRFPVKTDATRKAP